MMASPTDMATLTPSSTLYRIITAPFVAVVAFSLHSSFPLPVKAVTLSQRFFLGELVIYLVHFFRARLYVEEIAYVDAHGVPLSRHCCCLPSFLPSYSTQTYLDPPAV